MNTFDYIIRGVEDVHTVELLGVRELMPVSLDSDRRNQLVMFFKPEVFLHDDFAYVNKILHMGLGKINEFDAIIQGVYLLPGNTIGDLGLMNRHYGFINELSSQASLIITDEQKNLIASKLGLKNIDTYLVLGGHEFLKRYPHLTETELDTIWFAKPSTKIMSGFYVRELEYEGQSIILINGFHPAQLGHFTHKDHKLLLLLLESDTDWRVLRDEMIGHSFPEQAPVQSIRGVLHASPTDFGFKEVTIANNGVHLSAGPSEALFEIHNFLGGLQAADIYKDTPVVVKRLLTEGFPLEDIEHLLSNPMIDFEGKTNTVHNWVEHKNTDDLVSLWKHYRSR